MFYEMAVRDLELFDLNDLVFTQCDFSIFDNEYRYYALLNILSVNKSMYCDIRCMISGWGVAQKCSFLPVFLSSHIFWPTFQRI